MKPLISQAFCLIGILTLSCTYTPEDKYVKPIEQSDINDYSISLNSFNDKDTIVLYGPAQFQYDIGDGKGKLEKVEIWLGDIRVTESTLTAGNFSINYYPLLKTGIFELKIQFVATSGTGSLIDKLGGEKVQIWRKWIVKIDVDPPSVPVLSLGVTNGFSVVSWNAYKKVNFVKYRLEVTYSGAPKKTLYFNDPQKTSWVDSSYAGANNVQYELFVQNLASTSTKSVSRSGSLNLNISYNPADSIATVTLTPPVFYGAFKSYTLSENNVERLNITDPKQTIASFKLNDVGYNYSSSISLRLTPKDPTHFASYAYKTLTGLVATKKLPRKIDKFHYNADLNTIVGSWNNGTTARLFKIDPATIAFVDSLTIYAGPGFSIPYQGVYAYYSNPKKYVQVNLITHEEKSFDAIFTPSGFGSGPSQITASHSQVISYGWFGPGSPITYYGRVYDIVNNKVIFKYESNTAYNHFMSSDGQFLRTLDYKIYKISGGTTQLTGTLSFTGSWIDFRQDKCDEIMVGSYNRVDIYDANNLTLKRSVTAPSGSSFVCYDVMTKNIIFTNTGVRKIYGIDIETNQMKTCKADQMYFLVMNGIMFTNTGEYLKLF